MDNFSRESLTIEVDSSITGRRVVGVLERIAPLYGRPETIRMDNGPEFISKALDEWAHRHQVRLDFSRPGKPTDHAHIESFNGRFRQECLNQHWFSSLDDARSKIEAWRKDYNQERPHSALNQMTPAAFRAAWEITALDPTAQQSG